MDEDEIVDILRPPLFEKNGQTKTRAAAYADGEWLGTFNLWIVTRNPEPAIIYQQRSPKKSWAPGKLDVTADSKEITITVNKSSFPENWDNYHHKIALLTDRYFKGEQNLLY